MRLHIFYACVAAALLSCSNGVNNISNNATPITETNKNGSQPVTKNVAPEDASGTKNQNSSGKECDDQRPCCWNNRMMLW